MKKVTALLILFIFSLGSFYGFAKEDEAAAVTREEYGDVKVASELLNQASNLVSGGTLTRQKAEMALSLYMRAGQLFEKAEGIFKAVGVNYVSQNDINGAGQAKEACLKAITEIKQRAPSLPA